MEAFSSICNYISYLRNSTFQKRIKAASKIIYQQFMLQENVIRFSMFLIFCSCFGSILTILVAAFKHPGDSPAEVISLHYKFGTFWLTIGVIVFFIVFGSNVRALFPMIITRAYMTVSLIIPAAAVFQIYRPDFPYFAPLLYDIHLQQKLSESRENDSQILFYCYRILPIFTFSVFSGLYCAMRALDTNHEGSISSTGSSFNLEELRRNEPVSKYVKRGPGRYSQARLHALQDEDPYDIMPVIYPESIVRRADNESQPGPSRPINIQVEVQVHREDVETSIATGEDVGNGVFSEHDTSEDSKKVKLITTSKINNDQPLHGISRRDPSVPLRSILKKPPSDDLTTSTESSILKETNSSAVTSAEIHIQCESSSESKAEPLLREIKSKDSEKKNGHETQIECEIQSSDSNEERVHLEADDKISEKETEEVDVDSDKNEEKRKDDSDDLPHETN